MQLLKVSTGVHRTSTFGLLVEPFLPCNPDPIYLLDIIFTWCRSCFDEKSKGLPECLRCLSRTR